MVNGFIRNVQRGKMKPKKNKQKKNKALKKSWNNQTKVVTPQIAILTEEFLKKYAPKPLPTHEDMLRDGWVETFRVKSTDGYSKDEIWYKRK